VNVRRDGDRLFLKILGPVPESPLVPRTETSFAANWPGGGNIEFQVDGQGKVTGALAEWGVNGSARLALEPVAKLAVPAAVLDRYVGQWRMASGTVVAFRRDGTSLVVKPGTMAEVALIARSETRFQDPRGPVFEFQVDASGTLTGVILEQGNPIQRIPLTRVP
jgi:hypothetical protein